MQLSFRPFSSLWNSNRIKKGRSCSNQKKKCNSFNLLQLPYLAFRIVIHQLSIFSVLQLSQISRRTLKKIQQVNRKVYKLLVYNHEFTPYGGQEHLKTYSVRQLVVIENISDYQEFYDMMWSQTTVSYRFLTTPPVTYWIRSVIKDYPNMKLNGISYMSYENKKELEHYLNVLYNTFSIDHLDLMTDREKIFGDYRKVFKHPLFRKCHYVEFHEPSKFSTKDLENLQKMFDLHKFYARCDQKKHFNFQKMLKIPRISVHEAYNIKIEDLMNNNCKEIILWNNDLQIFEITKFICHWLSGKLPSLERLRLHMFHDWEIFEDILIGIDNKKRDENQPKTLKYGVYSLDCSNGRDIIRKDGQIATLFTIGYALEFVVRDLTL